MADAMRPIFTTIDGLSVRYADSGTSGEDAILFSPWPESIYAFARVWAPLSEQARLVAIDPPGFGQSQGRRDLMTPKAMSAFIVRAADVLGLANPHVVAPDIGTSSSLFAASAHPGRFRSLVVGSGGAAVPIDVTGALKDWVESTDLTPYLQLGGRKIVETAISTIDGYDPPAAIRADYITSYEGSRFAQTVPYAQSYREQLPLLADLLEGIRTPVRIIQGDGDRVVPPANAQFLRDRLPHSQLDFIEGAGHFCWEERPEEYAALVLDWWRQHRVATPADNRGSTK